jgi:hypothetical protein
MIVSKKTGFVLWAAVILFGAGSFATPSTAQTPADQWTFTALLYGYVPKISGSTTFRTGTTANIGVDPSNYLHNLNGAFMGALQAEKGSWVLFTDLVYADVNGSKSRTQDFSLGSLPIPVGLTLDANLKLTSTLWTLAGGYRFVATPQATLDLFGGARYLALKETLGYNLSADIGPIVGPLRQGSSSFSVNNWDGIVGAKGRIRLGDSREWFLPYYADVGTGQSKYTYQAYAGLGYTFSWGELIGVWRYISYKLSDSAGSELRLNGPAIGVAFHW